MHLNLAQRLWPLRQLPFGANRVMDPPPSDEEEYMAAIKLVSHYVTDTLVLDMVSMRDNSRHGRRTGSFDLSHLERIEAEIRERIKNAAPSMAQKVEHVLLSVKEWCLGKTAVARDVERKRAVEKQSFDLEYSIWERQQPRKTKGFFKQRTVIKPETPPPVFQPSEPEDQHFSIRSDDDPNDIRQISLPGRFVRDGKEIFGVPAGRPLPVHLFSHIPVRDIRMTPKERDIINGKVTRRLELIEDFINPSAKSIKEEVKNTRQRLGHVEKEVRAIKADYIGRLEFPHLIEEEAVKNAYFKDMAVLEKTPEADAYFTGFTRKLEGMLKTAAVTVAHQGVVLEKGRIGMIGDLLAQCVKILFAAVPVPGGEWIGEAGKEIVERGFAYVDTHIQRERMRESEEVVCGVLGDWTKYVGARVACHLVPYLKKNHTHNTGACKQLGVQHAEILFGKLPEIKFKSQPIGRIVDETARVALPAKIAKQLPPITAPQDNNKDKGKGKMITIEFRPS